MDRAALLQQLQRLAEHPNTPATERENAHRRIAELREAMRPPPPPPRASGKARLRQMRPAPSSGGVAGPRARPRALPLDWPFGWTGARAPVEYEVGGDLNGGLVVGWKCPSCGGQVERVLTARDKIRLSPPGRPEVLRSHLQHLTGGQVSQLCLACWDRWQAAS